MDKRVSNYEKSRHRVDGVPGRDSLILVSIKSQCSKGQSKKSLDVTA